MLPPQVNNLIEQFSRLPGIGPKTASRLTFYFLSLPKNEIDEFSQAVKHLTSGLFRCKNCYNITDEQICKICQSSKRDQSLILVVAHPLDAVVLERTNYNGLYHILDGLIAPIEGIGPDKLKIKELFARIQNSAKIKEVILATSPSLEGEATAMYLNKVMSEMIKNNAMKKIKISRIALGLPVGSDLEYADEATLERALEGRRET